MAVALCGLACAAPKPPPTPFLAAKAPALTNYVLKLYTTAQSAPNPFTSTQVQNTVLGALKQFQVDLEGLALPTPKCPKDPAKTTIQNTLTALDGILTAMLKTDPRTPADPLSKVFTGTLGMAEDWVESWKIAGVAGLGQDPHVGEDLAKILAAALNLLLPVQLAALQTDVQTMLGILATCPC